MTQLKLAIDLDGVLCRFDDKFAEILTKVTGKPCAVGEPDRWEWPRKLGFTPDEEMKAWEEVARAPRFWMSLDRYDDSRGDIRLHDLITAGHDIYFVTARHAAGAKFFTEWWLQDHCQVKNPTVILAKNKGFFCRAVGAHAFIDDKPSMCMDVRLFSPKTRSYLRKRRHNEEAQPYVEREGVILTDSLQTFLASELERLRPTLEGASSGSSQNPSKQAAGVHHRQR